MAIELIIEDGTASSPSANSYITVAELTDFCDKYGLTLSATTSTLRIQAILRGMAYVESEFNFKGEKYSADDPLEWPRTGVYNDVDIEPSADLLYYKEIPAALKRAACRAAYEEANSPGCLQANVVTGIRREKIDVLETEYFGVTPSRTVYKPIEGFLKGLLKSTNAVDVKRT